MKFSHLQFSRQWVFLIFLFLSALAIRLVKVGNYPPLLWDEASLGYNAYSLVKTGRDEYGQQLPLILKSFGDYKPGLYAYLAIPFVAVFGLTELAVRLPSVIFGALTPIFLYFLLKEILRDEDISFWAAFALAFLPAAIHFSRGAWEVNVMTAFLVLGSYFWGKVFLVKTRKKGQLFLWLALGSFSFVLALLTYQGAKMLVPLLFLAVILFWGGSSWRFTARSSLLHRWWHLFRLGKTFNFWFFFLFVFSVFWYSISFYGPAKNRLKVMSLFSYRRPKNEIVKILQGNNLSNQNSWRFRLFYGRWLATGRAFLDRYLNYFSPRFLAFSGDWNNPRHSAPYFGVIGHLNYLLFLLGLAFFLAQKHPLTEYFFLFWLLLAPLPAALSRDIVSGVRSLPLVVPLAVFIGYGFSFIFQQIASFLAKERQIAWSRPWLKMAFLFLWGLDFLYWGDLYFVHMVIRKPKEWLFGYKAAAETIIAHKNKTRHILMTNFYGQPYIYYLFYSRYPPKHYQRQAKLTANAFGDVGRVEKIDNLRFKSLGRGDLSCHNCLLIYAQDEILRSGLNKDKQLFSHFRPLAVINQRPMFYVFLKK